jgi:hypothetical protein
VATVGVVGVLGILGLGTDWTELEKETWVVIPE